MDRTTTSGWHAPVAALVIATAGIAAVFTATPAASGGQPQHGVTRCYAEITASGPLLKDCEQQGR